MVSTIQKADMIEILSETTLALNHFAGVKLSQGTIEIFTTMLFIRNKTLSMLCFIVKPTQNMKEVEKEGTGRRRLISSCT